MNVALVAVSLLTVTEKAPELAPDGTTALIEVSDHDKTGAAVPLSSTVLDACVTPKFRPVIVTSEPIGPEVGDMSVTVMHRDYPFLSAHVQVGLWLCSLAFVYWYERVMESTPFAREEVSPRPLLSYVCVSRTFPSESRTDVINDWALY